MFVRPFGACWLVQTPAKLNLFLEVLGRRPDGYHELETLMTTFSVYDSLSCQAEPAGELRLDCRWALGLESQRNRTRRLATLCPWEPLPEEKENLVYRAVRRLRERAGVAQGATLRLVKRIPAAAGLGGASSDAAAALVAANRAWNLRWSRAQLREVAAELGSDIPFFLTGEDAWRGAAICRGRGEILESLPRMPPLVVVAVRPPVGLSTAAVFRACQVSSRPKSVQELVEAIGRDDVRQVGRLLHNGLQEAASSLSPWIGRLQREFQRSGVLGHAMSGSGSTYFALCHTVGQARRLAGRLRQQCCGAVFWGVTGR